MRFATVFLGVSLLSSAFVRDASAQQPESLDDLLREVREASGAPYQYHLASTSRERHGGVEYALTSESEGSRYLIRRCASDVCDGLYVEGDRTYVVNTNGTSLPLPIDVDPLQSSLRAVATDAFTAPEFQSGGGRIERVSDGVDGGVRVERIVVATAHGAPLDVAIDAATHLVRTFGTQAGKVTFAFKDYRRVDGMMLPFEVDVDGKKNQVFDRRSRVDGALTEPGGLVPQMDGATSTTLGGASAPTVGCSIAGSATNCLIDTGNSGMVMSAELARRLGLRPASSPILAAFGSAVAGVVHAGALHIAGATYPPAAYVVVTNLHATGVDLALGADAFAHALITIDYAQHTLTIAPENAVASGLPITFENFMPITGAAIAREASPVEIDTGDDDGVTLPAAFYDAHPGLFANRSVRPNGDRTGRVGPVRIGSFVVGTVSANATKALGPSGRAHLGSDFLRHFRVTFDYAHERIAFSPEAGATRAP